MLQQPLPWHLSKLSLKTSEAGWFGWGPCVFGKKQKVHVDVGCRRGTGIESKEDQDGRAEEPCMY